MEAIVTNSASIDAKAYTESSSGLPLHLLTPRPAPPSSDSKVEFAFLLCYFTALETVKWPEEFCLRELGGHMTYLRRAPLK